MTQPPPGPWRPSGPLPPPQARPLPPRPVAPPPGHRPPPPGQHLQRGPQPPAPPQRPPSHRPQPTQPYPRQPPPGTPPYGQQPPPQYGPPPGFPPPGFPPPGPGFPPGPGHPPQGPPPWLQYPGHQHLLHPRPKSNTGPLIATVLVAVLVVAVGTVGLLALNGKSDNVADTGYDSPSYTTTTSYSDPFPTTTTSETTTTYDTSTDEETTYDTPTETTPAGPQPVYTLADNPLFAGDVGTPAVDCVLAPWQTTPQGAAAFFQSALPCLDAAWAPIMEYQGLPFFTPNLAFPEGTEWSSPCGSVSGAAAAAFYCGEDNTMYMPFSGLQTDMYGDQPGVYLALFAHEYGHHVQAMSGVLSAYAEARYNAGADTEAGLELSRRLELQAQCFSGMFLAATYSRGSVDDNILTQARTSQDRGDHNPNLPRDHGTDAHAIGWWEQGAQLNRTYQCNTWLSPPEDVA